MTGAGVTGTISQSVNSYFLRGAQPEVSAWVDGANPFRGETIKQYVLGAHQAYLADRYRSESKSPGVVSALASIERCGRNARKRCAPHPPGTGPARRTRWPQEISGWFLSRE